MYSIVRLIALLAPWPAAGLLLFLLTVTETVNLAGGENQEGLIYLSVCLSLFGLLFAVLSLFRLIVLKRRDDVSRARLMRALALSAVLALLLALALLDELHAVISDPLWFVQACVFALATGAATGALVFRFAVRKD